MYLGAVSVLFGEAVLLESFLILGFALAMLCFFHLFVVYYEEPRLKRRFGWAYEEYLCSVPRWLPRLKRNDASVQAQRL
jgi:protein-S-isoprenylcysteine O-methyltransferase Ste14